MFPQARMDDRSDCVHAPWVASKHACRFVLMMNTIHTDAAAMYLFLTLPHLMETNFNMISSGYIYTISHVRTYTYRCCGIDRPCIIACSKYTEMHITKLVLILL
ncbi:hypothetical protein GQ55_1G439300 [Panicum hallii var. hallii]|uniref:Uncharacterized protein n=1 Tax=Panicum hallii var. hallii TaxID=1504633 RepID=A0A2T7FDX2_9POAL|nr:hypothetical protein GQ55_1G439300 [Panicum hallii var. hallii]